VAKIAGIPHQVIEKAYRILNELESKAASFQKDKDLGFIDLFAPVKPQILIELEKLEIEALSPMEALKLLQTWKDKYKH
jgi:DNA mismatch repair protein MutS